MQFRLRSRLIEFTETDDEGKTIVVGSLTCRQFTLAEDQIRAQMEEDAQTLNMTEILAKNGQGLSVEEASRQNFREHIYPQLFACAHGENIPDEETAFGMPGSELYKWYDAAYYTCPEWFKIVDEFIEAKRKSVKALLDLQKKKEAKLPE